MSTHLTVSPNEAADRLAIRERSRQMRTAPIAVMQTVRCRFLPRTRTSWCTERQDPTPSMELHSRDALLQSLQT